jgi:hypothetical protein
VTGSGFVSGSTVRWNGVSRTTTFVSANQLTAAIPASDLVTAGTAQVTVFTPAPGGGTSGALAFTVTAVNPVPVLSTLAPTSALQGGPAFTLTVTGSNFVPASVVRWNGSNRTTTFVSATQLTAAIPASDLVTAGTAQVTGFSPAPGGGTSGAVAFTVTAVNPVPVLSTLAPSSALQGGPAFTLTVTGANFVPASTVRWNGVTRTTAFVSATQLTASIPVTDLVTAGTRNITVATPAPGGGTSSALAFTVTAVNPLPALSKLAPTSALQGGPAFTLTVTGSGFVPGSGVRWNGSSRTTTFVSATQLTASIPASDLVTAGTRSITVFTPAPGGGISGALAFTVTAVNPVPVLSALAPSNALQGGRAFTLTITGANFVPASTVRWNGGNRRTRFVSATQLTARIPATDLVTAGTRSITVVTPAPGGGTSGTLAFTVTTVNPVPALSKLAPTGALQGGPAFTLTVTGSGFVSASTVRWNGVNRTTTFVSATQLMATILATDIASSPGTSLSTPVTAQVTVFTPAPGGGTSSALPFTVTAVNPVPVVSALSPSSVPLGSPAFTLTVTGANFVPASVVQWNGSSRPTTFVSTTRLTTRIRASNLGAAGTVQVTVVTPAPGGGTSGAEAFTVTALNPDPTLSTIAPSSTLQGGPAFTLTVTGNGFVPASTVRWNGGSRRTTFVSATQLTARIRASDLAGAGTAQVTVVTPAPGGRTSGAVVFTVTAVNHAPGLSPLAPSSTLQGGPAFTLTVTGNGFVPASTGRWNGGSRTTTLVSPTPSR